MKSHWQGGRYAALLLPLALAGLCLSPLTLRVWPTSGGHPQPPAADTTDQEILNSQSGAFQAEAGDGDPERTQTLVLLNGGEFGTMPFILCKHPFAGNESKEGSMCLMAQDIAKHRAGKATQTLFRAPQPTLRDLALAGKLFKGAQPTPEAQRLFLDKAKAKAFLSECDASTDEGRSLRMSVTEQGLDLDELREWLEDKN